MHVIWQAETTEMLSVGASAREVAKLRWEEKGIESEARTLSNRMPNRTEIKHLRDSGQYTEETEQSLVTNRWSIVEPREGTWSQSFKHEHRYGPNWPPDTPFE